MKAENRVATQCVGMARVVPRVVYGPALLWRLPLVVGVFAIGLGVLALRMVPQSSLIDGMGSGSVVRAMWSGLSASVTAATGATSSHFASIKPVVEVLHFSASPSDQELFTARIFDEPLVPVGVVQESTTSLTHDGQPTKGDVESTLSQSTESISTGLMGTAALSSDQVIENQALAAALQRYHDAGELDAVAPLTGFLAQYPHSRWRASLMMNLGLVYRSTGYVTRALDALEQSWALSKDYRQGYPSAVADRAVAELADLNSRLGRMDRLTSLFAEIGNRDVRGSAGEKLLGAHEGLATMTTNPGIAFLCGPLALSRVRAIERGDNDISPVLNAARSTQQGTSLMQLSQWAEQSGMHEQRVKGVIGTAIPVPAVMHWKAGHFAAVIQRSERAHGRVMYKIQDPTFGDNRWVSQEALDEEASGYFMIAQGALPKGWTSVSETEAGHVWGKGYTTGGDPDAYGAGDGEGMCGGGGGGDGSGSPSDTGMTTYDFHALLAGLRLSDTPVGYKPPYGPAAYFTVSYNQRDSYQDAIPRQSNLGPKWTFNWLSYIQEPYYSLSGVGSDAPPAGPYADAVARFPGGGGRQMYGNFQIPAGGSYPTSDPERNSAAVLVNLSSSAGTTYQLQFPNGSMETYAASDGAASPRVYLSAVQDAYGNTLVLNYTRSDGTAVPGRVTQIVDAASAQPLLTFTYGNDTDPTNPGYYQITRVTDHFGRFASFGYDSYPALGGPGTPGSGRLTSITDVVGIVSQYGYGGMSGYAGTDSTCPDLANLTADFVCSLKTPYGKTFFDTGSYANPPSTPTPDAGGMTDPEGSSIVAAGPPAATHRWISATDPLGQTEWLEFMQNSDGVIVQPDPGVTSHNSNPGLDFLTEDTEPVPNFATATTPIDHGALADTHLDQRNTFYWNKTAYQAANPGGRDSANAAVYAPHAPADYTQARITHWLHSEFDGNRASGTKESEKLPLEGRVWYEYQQPVSLLPAPLATQLASARPTRISRVLDDGTTQAYQYTYNAQGNVTSMIDPAGRMTNYVYEPNGIDLQQILQVTGARTADLMAAYVYARPHLPSKIVDAAGQTTIYSYNDQGQTLTVTNPLGDTTTYTYDQVNPDGTTYGYLISVTDPLGNVTQYGYTDRAGNPDSVVHTLITPDGDTIITDRDHWGRPTITTYPDGSTTQTTYWILDPTTHTPTTTPPSLGLEATAVADRQGNMTLTAYDALRRVASTTIGMMNGSSGAWSGSTPPPAPIPVRTPAMATTSFSYSCGCGAVNSLQSMTDGNNHTTSWTRDVQGRILTKSVDNSVDDGSPTGSGSPLVLDTYVYEATTSRVHLHTDARGSVATYQYGIDNTPTQIAYSHSAASLPDPAILPGTLTYAYDPYYPRLTSATNELGTTNMTYVPAGTMGAGQVQTLDALPYPTVYAPLPTGSSLPNSDVITYGYDALGRRTTRTLNGITTTDYFDAGGRRYYQSNGLGGFYYEYAGNRPRVQTLYYPNGQYTAYNYWDATEDRQLQAQNDYDPHGNLLETRSYDYNHVHQVVTMGAGSSSTQTLQYDMAGQLSYSKIFASGGLSYSEQNYSYDGVGNRTTTNTDTQAGSLNVVSNTTLTYDSANNLTNNESGQNATALTHDADGNMTFDGKRTYVWDAENRLYSVSIGTAVTQLAYDALGRRVQINDMTPGPTYAWNWWYVWDGHRPLEERLYNGDPGEPSPPGSETALREYFDQGYQELNEGDTGLAGSQENYYYIRDRQGSVLDVTDATGTALLQYSYDAWGNQTRTGGSDSSVNDVTPFGFAGMFEFTSVGEPGPMAGLYLTLARLYNPTLGRWLTRDPLGERPLARDGKNPYVYVANDPVNLIDPLGLNCEAEQAAVDQAQANFDNISASIPYRPISRNAVIYSASEGEQLRNFVASAKELQSAQAALQDCEDSDDDDDHAPPAGGAFRPATSTAGSPYRTSPYQPPEAPTTPTGCNFSPGSMNPSVPSWLGPFAAGAAAAAAAASDTTPGGAPGAAIGTRALGAL